VSYRVLFTPAAQVEIDEAEERYEEKSTGLGSRFLADVDQLIRRLQDNPYQFPVVRADVRKALLKRFPYGLFFRLEPDSVVVVIGCLHHRRDPRRWVRK
jgi:toxin ParE1/3/4